MGLNMPDVSAFVSAKATLVTGQSIRDVVENLNETRLRSCFVMESGRVVGSISDGDIRRGFLAGHTLETPLENIMNTDFVSARVGMSPAEIYRLFREGIDVIPLLDKTGELVDLVFRGQGSTLIPVADPEITQYEIDLVTECVQSGWVSSVGRFVTEFEEEFAAYVGVEEAVTVSNGTAALELAMWTLGIGPGDEVLVPDLTFGATANAVIQVGATPVLVDVNRSTWCVDVASLKPSVTPRTRAIMVVHLYGFPAPMTEILEFARAHGLLVIEDCAEALGSLVDGRHVGSQSDAGAFSFFGNKTITTGEGGMVTFSSSSLARRARTIRGHGMSGERKYWHDEWGTNLRLTNLQAALGLAQLRRIDSILGRKLEIASRYTESLRPSLASGVELPPAIVNGVNSHWLYVVLLPQGLRTDVVGQRLLAMGVETRPVFYPLHVQPAFARYAGDRTFIASDEISARGLCLPSSVKLADADLGFVADCVQGIVDSQ